MYKKDEKEAALQSLCFGIGKFSPKEKAPIGGKNQAKKADSHLATVEMPKADKPTAAGEETSNLNKKPEEKVLSSEDKSQNSPVINTNPEMKKLSVVLSQAVRKAIATDGQYAPYNVGMPNRPQAPAPVQNPLPIGAAPQQPQQQQQPQNPAAYQGALGGPGAISPSSNPINNYGPISRSGDINGNAAFGVKNSPDSNKSAASICSILDNKDTRSEGKQVEDVKPTFQATNNKADLNPNDATNKKQEQKTSMDASKHNEWVKVVSKGDAKEINKIMQRGGADASNLSAMIAKARSHQTKKQATNKKQEEKAAGIQKSIGGQRWQLGEGGINPQLGYKYMLGMLPTPDVALRVGTPGAGVGIGLHPWPYIFSDKGQPSGRQGNNPRSFWKYMADDFRSPEDSFFLELGGIEDNAPAARYEKLLRDRGIGRSSQEIGMLAKILSESADVKRNSMARRLPAAVQGVLKNYKPENPKSLFKQSNVALRIYAKHAARG